MVNSIADIFNELNFFELHQILLDSDYYEFLFPFLLAYALLYAVLGNIKIFQYKTGSRQGKPIKPIITVIAFLVSFYGISFETSPGYSVGKLLMVMFPNISALTIGILGLYIVGSILGKDFFEDVFKKDISAYLFFTIAVIGLGSVVYYVGIAMGFWNFNPMDTASQWNVILAIAFLIMGIVFLFVDLVPFGVIFLMVFGAFVLNAGENSILEYFIDPVIFIILLVVVLLSWIQSDDEKKIILEKNMKNQKELLDEYGNKTSRVKDIVEAGYNSNQEKLNKYK